MLCFCAVMHKFFLDFKSFFSPFSSFYLKNSLFSLFYSGPSDDVKFDTVVLRTRRCLVHTGGKNVEDKFRSFVSI